MKQRKEILSVFKEYDKAIYEADKAKVGLGMNYFVNKMIDTGAGVKQTVL